MSSGYTQKAYDDQWAFLEEDIKTNPQKYETIKTKIADKTKRLLDELAITMYFRE